jgi:hypothetical protein
MFAQVPSPSTTAATTGTTPSSQPKENIQGAVQSSEFLFYSVALALLLLAAGGVFYFVDRWRKTPAGREKERETSLSMSSFREMYENGEITESEYHRLRDKLAAQLKVTPGGAVPAPAKDPFTGGKASDKAPPTTPGTPPDDASAK